MRWIGTACRFVIVALVRAMEMIAAHQLPKLARIFYVRPAAQFAIERRHIDDDAFGIAPFAERPPGQVERRVLPRHARGLAFLPFVVKEGKIVLNVPSDRLVANGAENGRASCREGVCRYV